MNTLTDRQRDALRRLARNGPNGHAAIHKGSLPSLERRGLVTRERSWTDGNNGRVVWTITPAGRVALGGSSTVRAAGTLDLTVHRRDPDVLPDMQPGKGVNSRYRTLGGQASRDVREWEGHNGRTVCGQLMLLEELWVDHEPEPNDPRCSECFAAEFGEPPDDTDDPELWPGEDDDAEFEEEPERRVETVKVIGGLL